ncbi:MAG: GHKL domain-containing protein, partial [Deltaproteobacteria bacterium]|nr:GHKL domain-containing protein [Deltaproteobacteria bacterium]
YDYIDKPFDKEGLRAAIRKGVERRYKTIELKKAQENIAFVKAQLRQSEKFAAIGQSIAGFVHELNNPLGAIMGFSDLLMMKDCPPHQIKDYIHQINEGAQLCKSIIDKFLTFARKHEPKKEKTQINTIIDSTLELKKHDFKRELIQVNKNLDMDLPETTVDYRAMQQVFLNILNNAQHAMFEQDMQKMITIGSQADGQWIQVRFQDTGEGIPKENIEKIFEPLFTTKEEGKGTGLGLSLCYEIIKEHHGNIYVASEPGKGACFVIEIPIKEENPDLEKVIS